MALCSMTNDFRIKICLVSDRLTEQVPFAYYGCQRSMFSALSGHLSYELTLLFESFNELD